MLLFHVLVPESSPTITACPECDCINRIPSLRPQAALSCANCGSTLLKYKCHTIDRTLSFALAGLLFALFANAFPVLTFTFQGSQASNYLTTGPESLMHGIYWPVALLILWTSLFAPAFKMAGLVYVLLPLKFGFAALGLRPVFKLCRKVGKWGLIEVYAAAILVAITKLDQMGHASLDTGAWVLFALFVCSLAATWSLDEDRVWNEISGQTSGARA